MPNVGPLPETSQLAIKAAAQLSIEVVAVTAMTDNITNTHTHAYMQYMHTHTHGRTHAEWAAWASDVPAVGCLLCARL